MTRRNQWIPRSGPTEDDFVNNRICPREDVFNEFKKLVLENHFSILEGEVATGKTVLARKLGYELKDDYAVYYFDCGLEREFKVDKLAEALKLVRGIIIIENIHLETQKIQELYKKISVKKDDQSHILFVANSKFRKNQLKTHPVDLTGINNIEINPFQDVDDIINHFISHHQEFDWSEHDKEQIKTISEKDYWMLTYALKGYVEKKGNGEPISWLETGINDELEELEKLNTEFPKILVALSALYQNEVLTEKSFLTNVSKLDEDALFELERRGEITSQKVQNKFVMYGLLHSSKALAYWKYGRSYLSGIEMPARYEDFIYKYAIFDTPNGLQAVINSDRRTQESVLSKLEDENKIEAVLKRELHIRAISDYIGRPPPFNILTDNFIRILADKICINCSDILFSMFCYTNLYRISEVMLGEKLSNAMRVNINKLVDLFSGPLNPISAGNYMQAISSRDPELAKTICYGIDPIASSSWLLSINAPEQICRYLNSIFRVEPNKGKQLCELIDPVRYVNCLKEIEHAFSICRWIHDINLISPSKAYELYALFGFQKLADILDRIDNFVHIAHCLQYLASAAVTNKAPKTIYGHMNIKKLAEKISLQLAAEKSPNIVDICTRCILDMQMIDPDRCSELIGGLDKNAMSKIKGIEKKIPPSIQETEV